MHSEKHTPPRSPVPLLCLHFQGFGASSSTLFHKFKGVTKLLVVHGIFVAICSSRTQYYFVKPLVVNK